MKASEKEAIEALKEKAVELTNNAFAVTKEYDDGGGHLVLTSDRDEGSEETPFKFWLERRILGWHVMLRHTPHGYVEAFYANNKKKE
jgi:hypothetical protein|tara:strand:+ start:689 stop:949 length:261 start_codon:yes stop_codon:yes gene_type:complete